MNASIIWLLLPAVLARSFSCAASSITCCAMRRRRHHSVIDEERLLSPPKMSHHREDRTRVLFLAVKRSGWLNSASAAFSFPITFSVFFLLRHTRLRSQDPFFIGVTRTMDGQAGTAKTLVLDSNGEVR